MFPDVIKKEIINLLTDYYKKSVNIKSISSVLGGDINYAYKITTNYDNFFIKWNFDSSYPTMFESEAKGLQLLKASNTFTIPEIIASSKIENYAFLLLKFEKQGYRKKDFWFDFGSKLAHLHQNTSDNFGLDFDNYVGSLKQSNTRFNSWNKFFTEERLEPMVKYARDFQKISCVFTSLFNNFYNKIDDIFPVEHPALLHGDLWNGNYLVAEDGSACLIDPAVYYGHREMDIAMTKLFGGFDNELYTIYQEIFPMEKGWQFRMDFYNLYPLMVHVNLFGGGYINTVENILRKI